MPNIKSFTIDIFNTKVSLWGVNMKVIIAFALFIALSGCVSINDINESFRRVDRAWLLEYQRTETAYRVRVINGNFEQVFSAVKETFLALNMPFRWISVEEGEINSTNDAPTPLTNDEWLKVVNSERDNIKKIGGWYMVMRDDPKGYSVIIKAKIKSIGGSVIVSMDYELDNLEYRKMGIQPSKTAPPLAVQLASSKFWNELNSQLEKTNRNK